MKEKKKYSKYDLFWDSVDALSFFDHPIIFVIIPIMFIFIYFFSEISTILLTILPKL
jgi:hypothetical protein